MLPKFFSSHSISLFLAAIVVVYFYFQPEINLIFSFVFFGFWIFGFFCDACITAKNSQHIARHETNAVFALLYARFGVKAGLVQFLIESAVIVVIPLLFIGRLDLTSSLVVAAVLGVSHLQAFYANRKFERSH